MGFKIVRGDVETAWYHVGVPAGSNTTLYVGQIVKYSDTGVTGLTQASAGPDVTYRPFGIVIGTDNKTPVYNSTLQAEYISSYNTMAVIANRTDFAFHEGMIAKGDPRPAVHVALIDSTTVIEGPICTTTFGTAPTVVTVTTADTNGLSGCTHSAADAAFTANNCTYYGRKGNNFGLYNASNAASNTTFTGVLAWPKVMAVNDTYVVVQGACGAGKGLYFDANASFVDNSNTSTNYYCVDILRYDLETAGKETVQFRFRMAT